MKKKAIGIAIAVMLLASVALVSCGGGDAANSSRYLP